MFYNSCKLASVCKLCEKLKMLIRTKVNLSRVLVTLYVYHEIMNEYKLKYTNLYVT